MSAILPAQGIAREHLSGFQLNLVSAPGNSGGPIFDPATGKVFGVLQGGPVDPKGNPILGITTAEPVYPAFDQGLIEKLLAHAAQAPQQQYLSRFFACTNTRFAQGLGTDRISLTRKSSSGFRMK